LSLCFARGRVDGDVPRLRGKAILPLNRHGSPVIIAVQGAMGLALCAVEGGDYRRLS
jgi:hypothetical protein